MPLIIGVSFGNVDDNIQTVDDLFRDTYDWLNFFNTELYKQQAKFKQSKVLVTIHGHIPSEQAFTLRVDAHGLTYRAHANQIANTIGLVKKYQVDIPFSKEKGKLLLKMLDYIPQYKEIYDALQKHDKLSELLKDLEVLGCSLI